MMRGVLLSQASRNGWKYLRHRHPVRAGELAYLSAWTVISPCLGGTMGASALTDAPSLRGTCE